MKKIVTTLVILYAIYLHAAAIFEIDLLDIGRWIWKKYWIVMWNIFGRFYVHASMVWVAAVCALWWRPKNGEPVDNQRTFFL